MSSTPTLLEPGAVAVLEFDGRVASSSCPNLLELSLEIVLEFDGHVASPSCLSLLEQGAEVVLELDSLVALFSGSTLLGAGIDAVLELDGFVASFSCPTLLGLGVDCTWIRPSRRYVFVSDCAWADCLVWAGRARLTVLSDGPVLHLAVCSSPRWRRPAAVGSAVPCSAV